MKKFEKNDLIINKVKAHPKSKIMFYNGKFLIGSSLLATEVSYLSTEDDLILLTESGKYIVLSLEVVE